MPDCTSTSNRRAVNQLYGMVAGGCTKVFCIFTYARFNQAPPAFVIGSSNCIIRIPKISCKASASLSIWSLLTIPFSIYRNQHTNMCSHCLDAKPFTWITPQNLSYLKPAGHCPGAGCLIQLNNRFRKAPHFLPAWVERLSFGFLLKSFIESEKRYASRNRTVLLYITDLWVFVPFFFFLRLAPCLGSWVYAGVWENLQEGLLEAFDSKSYCQNDKMWSFTTNLYNSITQGVAWRTKFRLHNFHDDVYLWGHRYKWHQQTTRFCELFAD